MSNIVELLKAMIRMNASDLHLKVGSPAIFRVSRELVPFGKDLLSPEKVEEIARNLMNSAQWQKFQENHEIDFAHTVEHTGRFRVNVFLQRSSIGAVIRFVKTEIPKFSELNLPEKLSNFCHHERGIILVTGSTNSGKSTTLASMVDYINRNFRKHILTVEDPIEYLHRDRSSIINQREVFIDTLSFGDALKYVLRQDPDVILIGEMRDADSFSSALQAAETGHLVMSTVHASSPGNCVERILDFFRDSENRDQARLQLASNLVAIIGIRLLPSIDGKGLIPAIEIMTGAPLVTKLIRENKLKKLPQIIASGQDTDMCSFDQCILELIQSGKVKKEAGLAHATNPDSLRMNLQGIFLDEGRILSS